MLTICLYGVFCVWSKRPSMVDSDFGTCVAINSSVSPVHVAKFPFFTSLVKIYLSGMKHVVCKKHSKSACYVLQKHCSQGDFHRHLLDHLHYQMIVGNTTIYYSDISTLIL